MRKSERMKEISESTNISKYENFLEKLKEAIDKNPTFYKEYLLDSMQYAQVSQFAKVNPDIEMWNGLKFFMLRHVQPFEKENTETKITRTFNEFKRAVEQYQKELRATRSRKALERPYQLTEDGGVEYIDPRSLEKTKVCDFQSFITSIGRSEYNEVFYIIETRGGTSGRTGKIKMNADDFLNARLLATAIMKSISPVDTIYHTAHLPAMIQNISPPSIKESLLIQRTGWVKIPSGGKRYSIKGFPPKGVDMDFEGMPYQYEVNQNGDPEKALEFLRALIESKGAENTMPIITSMMFATIKNILPNPDYFKKFVIAIIGETNNNKTMWSKAAMSMFVHKDKMRDEHLLQWGSEKSTGNALFKAFSRCQDMVMLLDNYISSTPPYEQGLIKTINMVVEGKSKQRLTSGESVPLTGMLMVTGENFIHNNQSIVARTMPIAFPKGDEVFIRDLKIASDAEDSNYIGFTWLKWLSSKEGRKIVKDEYNKVNDSDVNKQWGEIIFEITGKNHSTARRMISNLSAMSMSYNIMCQHPELGELFSMYSDEFERGMEGIIKFLDEAIQEAHGFNQFLDSMQYLLDNGYQVLHRMLSTNEIDYYNKNKVLGWFDRNDKGEYRLYISTKNLITECNKLGKYRSPYHNSDLKRDLAKNNYIIEMPKAIRIHGRNKHVMTVKPSLFGLTDDYFKNQQQPFNFNEN